MKSSSAYACKKILILEDDPYIQLMWEKTIKSYMPDFSWECVHSVSALTDKYGSLKSLDKNFMFFIVDIFLSGDMTGIEFVKQLTVDHHRIILGSSAEMDSLQKISKQHDLNCHLISKPFHISKAVSILKRMCGDYSKELKEIDYNLIQDRLNSSKMHNPVIMLTGCNSGVGFELANILLKNPYYRLVLTARQKSIHILKSQFKESEKLLMLPLDVTNINEINNTINQIYKKWGAIDVLINNAGVCFRSAVEHMDYETELTQMKTNYLGPVALMRAVIPSMREKGRGKIINVSSASGVMGMPTMGSYSASKHALEGASESLWYELQPFGINITVVRPGMINSNGYTHVVVSSKAKLSSQIVGPFSDFYDYMSKFVEKVMGFSLQDSKDVAKVILSVIETQNPPLWVNATLDAKVLIAFKKIIPERLHYKIINTFLKLAFKWGGYSKATPNRLKGNRRKVFSINSTQKNEDRFKDAA